MEGRSLIVEKQVQPVQVDNLNADLVEQFQYEMNTIFADDWFTSKSADKQTAFLFAGIATEGGEVVDLYKKMELLLGAMDVPHLTEELGDLLWHISTIATGYNIPLQKVFTSCMEKFRARHPRRYTSTPPHKNVIFIGPDGAGKTTLAELTAIALGYKYVKCTHREDNKYIRTAQHVLTAENCLFDRMYYPDNLIYSEVKGLELDAPIELYEQVERNMIAKDYVIVYVHADMKRLFERLSARGDEYIVMGEIGKIKSAYENFLARTKLPVISIDTSKASVEESRNKILKALKGENW